MKIYHYDGVTGEFLFEEDARPDPRENPHGDPDGVFLVPALSTPVAPPVTQEGQYTIFNGEEWEIRETPAESKDPEQTNNQLRNAPLNLFGGPSLKDVFNGN